MNHSPVQFQQTIHASPDILWQALTDPEQMGQWYFDLPGFRPEVGYEFQFLGSEDVKKYLHLCKITTAEPGKKLAYTWRYDGFPGDSLVTFELIPEGDSTRVVLTHEGLESFPQENTDFAKENFVEGWTHIIGTSLKEFAESR